MFEPLAGLDQEVKLSVMLHGPFLEKQFRLFNFIRISLLKITTSQLKILILYYKLQNSGGGLWLQGGQIYKFTPDRNQFSGHKLLLLGHPSYINIKRSSIERRINGEGSVPSWPLWLCGIASPQKAWPWSLSPHHPLSPWVPRDQRLVWLLSIRSVSRLSSLGVDNA